MRNLLRISNYYNRQEAWKDWNNICQKATAMGMSEEAQELRPPDSAGWKTIDKQIAKLRQLIIERQVYLASLINDAGI